MFVHGVFLLCLLSMMFYLNNSSLNDHETTLHALPSETSALHTGAILYNFVSVLMYLQLYHEPLHSEVPGFPA